ncbi:MAG: hypothetical protein AB2L07_20875 [Thermoanaerobaculaceae bacterium]
MGDPWLQRLQAEGTGLALAHACALAAALGVLLGASTGCRHRPEEVVARGRAAAQAKAAREARPFDQPAEAERYYRMRRQPAMASIDPVEAYRAAAEHRRHMPSHSLALDRELPPLAEDVSVGVGTAVSLAGWEPLGPGNVGGRTRALVIVPTDPATMYLGGVSGGVWKTTDGGASWTTHTDELANLAINALAMHPTDPNVLYAGTGEGYFREVVRGTGLPLRGAGIFASRDGGATWSRLPSTENADFQWVNDLVVSRADPRRLYAATRTGVWRSLDEGASWQRTLDPRVNGGCLDLAARTDTTTDWLFASCGTFEQATVYRATAAETAGAWEAVLSDAGMGRTSLAIAPSDQRVVYALAASNLPGPRGFYEQGLHAVFRSTSGGGRGSWSARARNTSSVRLNTLLLSNPLTNVLVECDYGTQNSPSTMGWYVNVIAADPASPDIVWAAGVDLFRSDDGGRSWGVASYWWSGGDYGSSAHADHHGIVFDPRYDGTTNQTMYSADDGGLYRTDNARAAVGTTLASLCDPSSSEVRFVDLNHGLGVTQFYHGAAFADGTRYLGGTQDNGTILGGDAAGPDGWTHILGGDGCYVAVDPSDENVVYAESQFFNFAKSVDGGRTFEDAQVGITDAWSTFLFVTPFAMDPNDTRRLWTGGARMWRTDDGAATWVPASATLGPDLAVSALAVAPGHPEVVAAGTDTGSVFRTGAALTAGAASVWQAAKPRDGFVTWLAFDPANPNVLWATYGGFGGSHVWRSADTGRTWTPRDGTGATALPDIPVHCIVVDPTAPYRLFLGTDLGVFVSLDGGATWAVENTGFATAVTESLSLLRPSDGRTLLFAFTHGRGAWRVEVPPAPVPRLPRRHLGRPST